MNLDTCTPGQRQSIEHVNGPLLVSAGAGSGKTFTLTQRIAYALLPESGPAAGGVDEVLAITFTEKAAAEIKARVKRTLRAEGLAEEALKVDGAWISTIHGMCSRILRTHALDLGIDPAFGIVGDAERSDLIADAIEGALGDDNDIIARGSYAALFDEYAARSSLPSAPSVASMLVALLDKAAGIRGGLDVVDFGPDPAHASALARELLLAYEAVQPALERAKQSATSDRARAQADDAIQALGRFLADVDTADDLRALAATVESCAYLPCTFGDATVKAEVKAYQAVHAYVAQQLALGLAFPLSKELLTLAHEVSARYEAAKRALCKLDNDDLLTRTLAAFEEYPDIAQRYEHRFKLVMVDEFQDTSQLQIDMIARLAGKDCAHLCTVGDAQQSIYRFRGADVNVYEAHKRAMRSDRVGALYVELAKNFRSHADVLSFVDRVFEQPQVFGDAFMSLEPNLARLSRFQGRGPRIDLVLTMQPAGKHTGVGVGEVKQAGAREIARRFAALREDGHAPGDMVVLLGKMSRAGVYADALRAEGFECVVTGGSQFASAPEVRVVARFLEALANPANTAALFEVLTSDMVRLSADDFLELTTEQDAETGQLRRRDLDRGFARLADCVDTLSPRLAHAVQLLSDAQRDARVMTVACTVQQAMVRSGWMARLEGQGAQGLARAANILKAIRLIDSLESERHLGLASTARAFADELAVGLKESPGALSGAGGDVVKIMTIHASKGLEFPIVALADFADARVRSSKLLAESCGSVLRTSLAPGSSLLSFPQVAKRSAVPGADALDDSADLVAARLLVEGEAAGSAAVCTQAAYRAVLAQRVADEELAEARRKLYVGLTRASEALVVAMDAKAASAGKPTTYAPLVDDIRSALCGEADFPEGVADLPYGGTAPARFERVLVQPAELNEGEDTNAWADATCEQVKFFVPTPRRASVPREPWRAGRGDVFSYSSIASARPSLSADAAASSQQCGCDEVRSRADADKATGLGSAFHRAAQFAVETGKAPDEVRLCAFAAAYQLSPVQFLRLSDACARWFASNLYAEVCSWPLRRAEVPFFERVGDAFLEGELDLLCTDAAEGVLQRALVIDYKTGGSEDESYECLVSKHELQAQCYAWALLAQGYAEVELRFVRIEHLDNTGEPQVVCYQFALADKENLAHSICAARG